jgi:hypothetical protein
MSNPPLTLFPTSKAPTALQELGPEEGRGNEHRAQEGRGQGWSPLIGIKIRKRERRKLILVLVVAKSLDSYRGGSQSREESRH